MACLSTTHDRDAAAAAIRAHASYASLLSQCDAVIAAHHPPSAATAPPTAVELLDEVGRLLHLKAHAAAEAARWAAAAGAPLDGVALARNTASLALSPSPLVDAAWHALMLVPHAYYAVCAAAWPAGHALPAGGELLLSHNPSGADDADAARRARYESTLAAYAGVYRRAGPAWCWPGAEARLLYIINVHADVPPVPGEPAYHLVWLSATMTERDALAQLPPSVAAAASAQRLRLYIRDKVLEEGVPLREQGVSDGDPLLLAGSARASQEWWKGLVQIDLLQDCDW
jgi:hypothetical protein